MYYLFINGKMMPSPPQSAVMRCEGGTSVIRLADGEDHMLISTPPPSELTLGFMLPAEGENAYDEYGDYNAAEYERFISSSAESVMRVILIRCGEDGRLCSDVNTEAVADELSFSDSGGGRLVKMKLTCLSGEGARS